MAATRASPTFGNIIAGGAIYPVAGARSARLKKEDDLLSSVIGRWRHSANHADYNLGALTFTGDDTREWRVIWLKPLFDFHLKGSANANTPPVLTYATGLSKLQMSNRLPMGRRVRSI